MLYLFICILQFTNHFYLIFLIFNLLNFNINYQDLLKINILIFRTTILLCMLQFFLKQFEFQQYHYLLNFIFILFILHHLFVLLNNLKMHLLFHLFLNLSFFR